MTQYDTIALDYQKISAAVPLRDAEWYSLQQRLGDLTGLSVLDLACGDGMGTRLLKRWGAAQVVGVDISPQMIALARQQEEAQPMGIEYRVVDAATLGRIGEFDRVSAAYLLHYAENREQLRRMAQTACDNLKPGQHFVASIANVLQPPQPVFDQRKYGFSFRLLDETLHEGARLRGTLFLGEKTVEFDFHWLPWEAYEEAFRTVGFSSWKIEPFLIPPDSDRKRGEGFWDEYIAAPSGMHITCQKYGRRSMQGSTRPATRADYATLRSRRVGNPPLKRHEVRLRGLCRGPDVSPTRRRCICIHSVAGLASAAAASLSRYGPGTGEGLRSQAQGEGAAAADARRTPDRRENRARPLPRARSRP